MKSSGPRCHRGRNNEPILRAGAPQLRGKPAIGGPGRDPTMYNFYAGMVALASGLEIEISAMKQRLERIEAELSTRPR
jgi:hypothetical protein